MNKLRIIALALLLPACTTASDESATAFERTEQESQASVTATEPETSAVLDRVVKTEAEWRALLTPEQYRITREAGTERAGTGEYNKEKRTGSYLCVCCNNELFHSKSKFESGTGWPSFFEPAVDGNVGEVVDSGHGMVRTEVTCARCDAHLGHVFPDGPEPTGQRYCINSAALVLRED